MFRVEAFAEEYNVQLDRGALRDAFAGNSAGERFFSGLKEDDWNLTFRVQGRQRVETHVGLV